MQRFFVYTFALWVLMMMCGQISQAAPVIPQIWLDDHGEIFAIALDGPSDQDINIISKQALSTDEENNMDYEDEEDEMYTTPPAHTVIIVPNHSLKDKIVNYVNTVLIPS